MPLNPAFLGRTYPATPARSVRREEIRAFAEAFGVADPACHDPAAAAARGHRDLVAPPTFAIVLSMAADYQVVRDPELGLDYGRVVHREQRFVHQRPILAGDVLTVTCTVSGLRTVAGHDLLTTTNEIADDSGKPVCTTVTTLAARTAEGRP